VVWGSTWLVIKIGYGGLGPFNVAALRFFLAGALFAPMIWLFRALRGERITRRKLTGTLVAFLGVAGLFGDRVRLDAAEAGPMLAIVASALSAATVGEADAAYRGARGARSDGRDAGCDYSKGTGGRGQGGRRPESLRLPTTNYQPPTTNHQLPTS
jgi:drug/metabolite transporter (DMT)-like permease